MRGRLLNLPTIGRAAGFAFVSVAILLAAVHVAHDTHKAEPLPANASASADPLTGELFRCQTIARAAKDDPACEAAWAENRRRFFTYRPAPNTAASPAAATNSTRQ
jgi:conjugative transfer region protein TrbK